MHPSLKHRFGPPREAWVVVFSVVTLLLTIGLIASKFPAVVVIGLATWVVLALCINSCDVSELAGRLLSPCSGLRRHRATCGLRPASAILFMTGRSLTPGVRASYTRSCAWPTRALEWMSCFAIRVASACSSGGASGLLPPSGPTREPFTSMVLI
jgi:hypothetical protein